MRVTALAYRSDYDRLGIERRFLPKKDETKENK
jgi:hypothetical protein